MKTFKTGARIDQKNVLNQDNKVFDIWWTFLILALLVLEFYLITQTDFMKILLTSHL